MAIGDDRDATLELGRRLARSGDASSVIVHVAHEGWDRKFVSALRAVGPVDELAAAVAPAGTRGVWESEFRRVKHYGQSWPDGEPSPGVGLVFGIWRLPGLSYEEFDAYWRDGHAPLALEHHVGMWDYTQCSFRRPLVDHATDYDGVAICQLALLRQPGGRARDRRGCREVRRPDPGRPRAHDRVRAAFAGPMTSVPLARRSARERGAECREDRSHGEVDHRARELGVVGQP
jgi:hypothetical protein